MSLRLLLIHFIYRIVFGVGIAAIIWAGAHLVYVKTFPLRGITGFKSEPLIMNGMPDLPSSQSSSRTRTHRGLFLEGAERESPETIFESVPPEISTWHLADGSPVRSSGRFQATPLRSSGGKSGYDSEAAGPFFLDLPEIRVGDVIQFSSPRGTFRYFVTTTEILDPAELRIQDSSDRSELTIITSGRFPAVGAIPQQFVVHARPLRKLKN
jgi:hypothetical protein